MEWLSSQDIAIVHFEIIFLRSEAMPADDVTRNELISSTHGKSGKLPTPDSETLGA